MEYKLNVVERKFKVAENQSVQVKYQKIVLK